VPRKLAIGTGATGETGPLLLHCQREVRSRARTSSAMRCNAHSSMVYRQCMLRTRALCGMRLHISSKLSSLVSTLLPKHASAAEHWCGPAASGPGQQAAACDACAGTAPRPLNLRDKNPAPGHDRWRGHPQVPKHATGCATAGTTSSSSWLQHAARRATRHAGSEQPTPQQGGIRPAQEARA